MPFGQSRAVVNSVNSDERGWEVGFKTRICKQSVSVTVGAVLCKFCLLDGMSCSCVGMYKKVSIPGWIGEEVRI